MNVETLRVEAEQAEAQGRTDAAIRSYRELLARTHEIDYEYEEWAQHLAALYVESGQHRKAALLFLYLSYLENAVDVLDPEQDADLVAHLYQLQERHVEAAGCFERAGRVVQAAVAYQRGGQYQEAQRLWSKVAANTSAANAPYERALVHYNLGNITQELAGQSAAGSQYMAEAQRLLEEVADEFESRGRRERAFDCYHAILQLGRASGTFENVAEGYINCIRVLKSDGLKFYVLQFYEDFLRLALERKEFHAAATLFKEAADYCNQQGLPYGRFYLREAARAWLQAAELCEARGRPLESVENALVAAAECYSAVGDYGDVRETFGRLADLDLPDKRRKRYRRIAGRLRSVSSDRRDAPRFPEYIRQANAYAEIWFVDLVEWELAGDPAAVALTMVGDRKIPTSFRRAAVNLVLFADETGAGGSTGQQKIADYLGRLRSYAALAPLERMFASGDPAVRRAVVDALTFLPFKRALALVMDALGDRDEKVREQAVQALGRMHFSHAFEPLTRVFRENSDESVRLAALHSISRIQSIEAAEFLVNVVREGESATQRLAAKALSHFDNAELQPIIEEHLKLETKAGAQRLLRDVLRSRPR